MKRRVNQIPIELENEIARLYQSDSKPSSREVAKLLGISKPTVCRYLRKRNLTRDARERAKTILRSPKNPRWKGGTQHSGGYIYELSEGHPRSGKRNRVAQHILVWERVHKMSLPKGWHIHHLNGIKDDNRPENLVAYPANSHIHILQAKAKRIRELEMKIKLLERTLDQQQLIFWSEN